MVDVRTVATRLGHASPTTTLNTYSHFVPEAVLCRWRTTPRSRPRSRGAASIIGELSEIGLEAGDEGAEPLDFFAGRERPRFGAERDTVFP